MTTRTETSICDFTIPGAAPHYPPDLGLEPFHLDISLALDLPGRSARGTVVTSVRANREGVRGIELSALDFEAVRVADDAGEPLDFDYDGSRLAVRWGAPFAHGEERRFAVSYELVEPVSGLHFAGPDEQYPDRARWAATDHETERARYWLPCVDLPAVRTTLAFHLTAPRELTILANGVLEREEEHDDGTKTAHWRLDWPCPSYLVCFALGEFVRADDEAVGGREIAYFAAKGRAVPGDLMRSFGRTPKIMDWLVQRLGTPFPFPKYFQFALPQFGGAMENISLVSWNDGLLADETLFPELGEIIDSVNVHEMGHSYFGDSVVIRDFAHAWLKESWATYLQACWLEDHVGADDQRYELYRFARAYMDEADRSYQRPIVTRVFNSSWDMYDRHLYPGGAFRLHMLRRSLTDDVFWTAVQDYLQTFSGKTVETEDFRKKLEAHSGRSLVRFFDEWIYGKGYPKLKATFTHDAEKAQATLAVEQTQTAGEKEEAPLFHFDLVVAWETADGEWRRRTLVIGKREESFLLPMAAKPRQIRIDPDGDVLCSLEFNPGDDLLRHALGHAPDVVGRILAAHELAKTAKRANLDAVADAFRTEPFWGVRNSMVNGLARSKTARAAEHLAELVGTEEHPRVLRLLAEKLGDFRTGSSVRALTGLLDRHDVGPLVRATALRALGRQRGETGLPLLTGAAGDDGWRGLVRSGALAGLAETHTLEAYELLLSRARYGAEPDDTAAAAATALGTIASHLERPQRAAAIERLRDLLRDPRPRVRTAAAGALGNTDAKEAAGDIERMMATLPRQSHPEVRRIVSKLRGDPGGKPETPAVTERIEKLEERNRQLEARIDMLEKRAETPPAS